MQVRDVPSLHNLAFTALIRYGQFQIPANSTPTYQQQAVTTLEKIIYEKCLPRYLEAVINGEINKVSQWLDRIPELLIIEVPTDLVVESKHTSQKFYAKNSLIMSAKLKKLNMLELQLSYLDKLEQTDEVMQVRRNALSHWSCYEIQASANGQNEIVIPEEYVSCAQSLIDAFTKETFPNGWDKELSENTEFALSTLYNKLLTKSGVNLDNYPDVELLLHTLYQAYYNNYRFMPAGASLAFGYRVIGVVQRFLQPETAQLICQKLDLFVKENIMNPSNELLLRLLNSAKFYDSSSEKFFKPPCALGGKSSGQFVPTNALYSNPEAPEIWEAYLKKKQNCFAHMLSLQCHPDQLSTNRP